MFMLDLHSRFCCTFLLIIAFLSISTNLHSASRPQAIKVVMDKNYPPYVFEDSEGALHGIVIDQWRLWEQKTGIKAEITGLDWDKAISRMQAGDFDVIDTIFKTEKRSAWLDFTPAYAKLEVPIFFDKNITGLTDAPSLKGFAVAVKSGDDAVDVLKRNGVDNLLLFNSYEAIIQAAREQKVNVFVVDKPPALYFLYKSGMQNQFKHSAPLNVGEFHRAVLKGKGDLLQVVEEGFGQISTDELQRIETRWSGASLLDHVSLPYFFIATISLGLLILALFAWTHILRKAVLARTAELKTSEERFQAIYNSVNDAIFIHDIETGAILDVNQRMCEMFGWSREEACTMPVEGISSGIPPYSQADAAGWMSKAVQGIPQFFEWQAKDKNGKLFWVENNMRRAQVGAVDRILVTVRDISNRKLAEESLRKNQAMLKHILDSVPQFIFWKDRNSVYLGCNQTFATVAGLNSPDQIVGKTDFDLPWLKEESEAYRADDQYVMSNNIEKLHIIEQQKQIDGKRLWIDTSKVPLLDEQGKVYGILGIFDDITERRQAEKALLDSESRYRMLFESAGDAIIISFNNIIMDCNEKALELFGCFGRGQIVGQSIINFSADTQADNRSATAMIAEKFTAALHGEAQFFPWKHQRCDGVLIETEVTVNRIDLGDAGNLLAIIRDVTAQKKSELQLRQSQKMDSLGTLAGGIAHDFNNILNAIIGYTDLAMIREKDEEQGLHDDLLQVRQAANRATALVRQILTFSRKQQQEKTPLQISLVVKEAIKLLRSSIPSTIDIRQSIISDATVLADATQIHQLVMNLCTNAYQSMMDCGGLLRVNLKEEAIDNGSLQLPPGSYVTLSVSDTGCGMDQDTVPKIFEPYFTTKEVGKGTGLGLAVVHGIVQDHQGKIIVSSEPGHGTTFNVYLPIIMREAVSTALEVEPPVSIAHERIMVVDDEGTIVGLANQFLTQAGYRVATFNNGLEAWEALSQAPHEWDLLITDQTMPKMTGEQLATKVLTIRPDLPIILCSGYSNTTTNGEQAKITGVFTSLQKPVGRNMLLTQVAKALAEKSQITHQVT